MKLVAAYIKKHKFLFNNEPQVLNFGGKYFYDFRYVSDTEITIDRKENLTYIDNFYSEEIMSVSAIVGANGTGKTSLLKIIHKSYQEDTPAIFVYEDLEQDNLKYYIDNRIGIRDKAGHLIEKSKPKINFFENIEYSNFNPASYTELYYSAVYDKNITSFHSILNIETKHSEKTLEEIYNDSILKEIIFLHDEVSEKIKIIYPDFPDYGNIIIKAKKLYNTDFTKVYIDSNLGNPNKGETLKHRIERDLGQKELPSTKILLEHYLYILKAENITDTLKEVWNLPQYKNENENKSHLIHDSNNFLTNIEIALLSYLVLNIPHSITDFSGSFGFSKILEAKSFDEALDLFLALFIIQIDKRFYDDPQEIKIKDHKKLMQKCDKLYLESSGQSSPDNAILHEKIIAEINGLKAVRDFYSLISENQRLIENHEECSYLNLSVKSNGTKKLLSEIIRAYTNVKKYFSNIPIAIKDFIDIEVDKKLSFGEKSLLNLYATLFDFTLEENHTRHSKNYLLILDEADLGYHPLWKRKYIDALNKTLPEIFNTLRVGNFDKDRSEEYSSVKPEIQIIFTTHDPLTLSDLPNSSIVFLKKEAGFSKVLKIDDSERPTKTFGANISNLLSDSFFIKDGLIGDFAKEKIEEIIIVLNDLLDIKNPDMPLEVPSEIVTAIKQRIYIIDEPIIQAKLIDMFNTIFDHRIDDEISELENRIKYLMEIKRGKK